jgi:transposase
VSDAQWLCQLLELGLLSASFVPPKPVRELRELTRRRRTLVRDRAQEANRLHKALEDTRVKLDCESRRHSRRVRPRDDRQAARRGARTAKLAGLAKGRMRGREPGVDRGVRGVPARRSERPF